MASDPEVFSIPAYVGVHGRVGIKLDRVDAEDCASFITEACDRPPVGWRSARRRAAGTQRLGNALQAQRPR
jgi:hypothetical protein